MEKTRRIPGTKIPLVRSPLRVVFDAG